MLFISCNFLFGYIMAVMVPGTGEWIAALSLVSYFYYPCFSSWQKYIHIINLHRKRRNQQHLNTSPFLSKLYVCLNAMVRYQYHANLEYSVQNTCSSEPFRQIHNSCMGFLWLAWFSIEWQKELLQNKSLNLCFIIAICTGYVSILNMPRSIL